jgi:hypothetical protein
LVVALLALYTLFFSVRPGRPEIASGRLESALATQAGGSEEGADADTPEEAKTAPAAKSGKADVEEEVSAPEVWGSDPFVRDWLLIDELRELQLRAITMGGEKAYVLINDQILEEGDIISGKRIASIESDKVILAQGGRTFTLLLGE